MVSAHGVLPTEAHAEVGAVALRHGLEDAPVSGEPRLGRGAALGKALSSGKGVPRQGVPASFKITS